MRTQQTKLTPHPFAQPEKISQPGVQPGTPSPSFATAADCLTVHAYRTVKQGAAPVPGDLCAVFLLLQPVGRSLPFIRYGAPTGYCDY